MKTSHLMLSALGSAAAVELPQGFDLNGSCAQACDSLFKDMAWKSTRDHEMANLDCHNGCMSISQMPALLESRDSSAKQKRAVQADEVYNQMASELGPDPDAEDILSQVHLLFACIGGCDPGDEICGFGCFFNISAMNPRQDGETPEGLSRRGSDGPNDDDPDGYYGGGRLQSPQVVLASRDEPHDSSCLVKCNRGDIQRKNYKCVDACALNAGFISSALKVKVRDCMTPPAENLQDQPFKVEAQRCQDQLDIRMRDSNNHPAVRRQAPHPSNSFQWGVSTTTWATSGTLAMLVPTAMSVSTSHSTTTTTMIAEHTVTATARPAYRIMSVMVPVEPVVTATPVYTPSPVYTTSPVVSTSFKIFQVPGQTKAPEPKPVPLPYTWAEPKTVKEEPATHLVYQTSTEVVKATSAAPPPTSAHSTTSCESSSHSASSSTEYGDYTVHAPVATWVNGEKKHNAAPGNFGRASGMTALGLVMFVAGALLL